MNLTLVTPCALLTNLESEFQDQICNNEMLSRIEYRIRQELHDLGDDLKFKVDSKNGAIIITPLNFITGLRLSGENVDVIALRDTNVYETPLCVYRWNDGIFQIEFHKMANEITVELKF